MLSTMHWLLVEDDLIDVMTVKRALKELQVANPLRVTHNGEEALAYLRSAGHTLPGLILLDLNMPRMDGRTALVQLKQDPTLKRIPVIALTTSNADDDIHRTYDLGVTAYVSKPGTHRGLIELIESLEPLWSRIVTFAAR
jgi:CheY-like chemotaxis protein